VVIQLVGLGFRAYNTVINQISMGKD